MILSALSLMIFALVFVEVASEVQVDGLNIAVSNHEANLTEMQAQKEVLRQMLQRLAIASLSDPALVDVLHKNGVRINNRLPRAGAPASAPSDSKPAPPPPDVPPVAQ